jgi:hypothetical protein
MEHPADRIQQSRGRQQRSPAEQRSAHGDEVITRRYEFYKYTGPLDPESNEASCDNYPQISDPGDRHYKAECDPATVTVLGDYIGAQMAGFNVEAVLGLVDHIQDGDLDELYTMRTVVVGGNTPYVTSVTVGSLPPGLGIDSPTASCRTRPPPGFVHDLGDDADAVQVTKAYTMIVAGAGPIGTATSTPTPRTPRRRPRGHRRPTRRRPLNSATATASPPTPQLRRPRRRWRCLRRRLQRRWQRRDQRADRWGQHRSTMPPSTPARRSIATATAASSTS